MFVKCFIMQYVTVIANRFAELVAGVFLSKNFKVYLFSGHTPTPYTVLDCYFFNSSNPIYI